MATPPISIPRPAPRVGRGSSGGTSPLPEGKQWLPHFGARQRLRELKKSYRRFEKIVRADRGRLREARDRLFDVIAENVAPELEELAAMTAIHAALVKSSETGKPIEDFLDRAADELISVPRVSESWNVATPDGSAPPRE